MHCYITKSNILVPFPNVNKMGKRSRAYQFYYSNICLELCNNSKSKFCSICIVGRNLQPAIILCRTHTSENIFTVYYEG